MIDIRELRRDPDAYIARLARKGAEQLGRELLEIDAAWRRETAHAEVPITHLICRRLIDRSDLLHQLSASEHDADNAALDRADAVRRPDPGSARAKAGIPASRDFR